MLPTFLVTLLLALPQAPTTAATVDRVAAVVGTTPILESDLELAQLAGLVAGEDDETGRGHRSRLLEARIRLELQYRHLEESGALLRLTFDVGATISELDRRVGGNLEARLAEHGLTRGDLAELGLRLAATQAYVEQRLIPRVTVSRAELEAEHARLVEKVGQAGGPEPPPIETLADQLEHLALERKLNAEIEQWLELARERFPVYRFHP